MQFPVRALSGNKNFENSLTLVINKADPDAVILPFWFDRHSDHIAVSKAVINIKKEIDLNFMVYSYAVFVTVKSQLPFRYKRCMGEEYLRRKIAESK